MMTVRRGARPHSNVRLTTYQKLKRTSVLTLPKPIRIVSVGRHEKSLEGTQARSEGELHAQ